MYKVIIKPDSSFNSNLTSITLFGALCHTINELYGTVELDKIKNRDTKLVVSNVYPVNYMIVNTEKLQNVNTHEFIEYSFDKDDIVRNGAGKVFIDTNNIINSNLYFFVDTNLKFENLEKIISVTLQKGLGGKKNIGHGTFRLVSIDEFDISSLDIPDSNGYIVLSDYIPNENDSIIGNYKARVIRSCTIDGIDKSPVYCINAGSRFIGKPKDRVIGQILIDSNTGALISGESIIVKIKG